MRNQLSKALERGLLLDIIYMDKNGGVSKRRIKVIQVGESSLRTYCYLRQSKRTFTIDNVLALVPVTTKESMVI